jgi:hypothetical protein
MKPVVISGPVISGPVISGPVFSGPMLSGLLTLTLMGLVGCDSKQAKESTSATHEAAENALKNPKPQDFSQPIISSKSTPVDASKLPLATVPVKGLQPSTPVADRTNQTNIASSGRDPFASILPEGATLSDLTQFSNPQMGKSLTPVVKKTTAQKAKATNKGAVAKAKSKAAQPIALRPNAPIPLSAIPLIPVNNPLPAIPGAPIGVPMTTPKLIAPPSPTALADEVEVTGVIHAGDRVMAIVKAPEESTARYVNSGDTLSGGRVIVREIRVGQAGQPTVVLEQNGQRVTKSIGAIARMTAFRGL